MANLRDEPIERLVAENVSEAVWLRLRRLTSSVLCSKILSKRAPLLDPDLISKKGEQTAYAVRSALGYWETNASALNAKVLTRYYALLQISIADQAASPNSELDLEQIQRHTEAGHGLATLVDSSCEFPMNYKIACLKSGHFYTYCQYRGVDLDANAFAKRPRKFASLSDDENKKLVSLADMFRRVPELQPLLHECLNVGPLSFQVHHSDRNMSEQMKRVTEHSQKTGQMSFDPPTSRDAKTTYVSIYSEDGVVTPDYLNSLSLPFQNITLVEGTIKGRRHFDGEITHAKDVYWHQTIDLYKSGYSATSVIAPFWGIRDPFLIHFVILYALSIVVRYLPSLWHDIEDGTLNHLRALIEHYLTVVDNVVPRLAIERITGTRLMVVQPGSLMAPG
jgi:hypothetical protein